MHEPLAPLRVALLCRANVSVCSQLLLKTQTLDTRCKVYCFCCMKLCDDILANRARVYFPQHTHTSWPPISFLVAGRGLLVRASLAAAADTGRQLRVYAHHHRTLHNSLNDMCVNLDGVKHSSTAHTDTLPRPHPVFSLQVAVRWCVRH